VDLCVTIHKPILLGGLVLFNDKNKKYEKIRKNTNAPLKFEIRIRIFFELYPQGRILDLNSRGVQKFQGGCKFSALFIPSAARYFDITKWAARSAAGKFLCFYDVFTVFFIVFEGTFVK
jgi:hypothetical protein